MKTYIGLAMALNLAFGLGACAHQQSTPIATHLTGKCWNFESLNKKARKADMTWLYPSGVKG